MRIEYHRTLIADHVRSEAFHAALSRLIVPGDVKGGRHVSGVVSLYLGKAPLQAPVPSS